MPDVNRIGFTQLSSGEGGEDRSQGANNVNIIFVHGLRGHPLKTWASSRPVDDKAAARPSSRRHHIKSWFRPTNVPSADSSTQESTSSRQQQVFWPQDFLAKDISRVRVWTYGYNADVVGGLFQANNKNSISEHGRDLAVRLEREIENQDPIVFVAHSLGGVLVKDAIRRSKVARQRTRFIVFLGTPHRGSEIASWGEVASNLARLTLQDTHKKIVETLEVNSEVLENIHDQFVEVLPEHTQIHSFQEGRGISGVKGLHGKIVSDFSSKLGLPKIENVESIDANHMQIARCADRSDESYRSIAGVLKQFLKSANPTTDSPVRSATHLQQEATSIVAHRIEAPCSSTPSYCIPFLQNRRFTGRTKKLEELERKLLVSHDSQKLALVGLGGVGKTQVALQFAYTVKARWPGYSIFWVPAVSGESFEQSYRDIAVECSIALDPTQEDSKKAVQRYLSSASAGRWLMIVDNCDDEEVLFGIPGKERGMISYLPQSINGRTLFTTRHRERAVSLAGSDVVEIQELDKTEAETFLAKSLTQQDLLKDHTSITALLHELAFLPLAIAQAAAYLNAMQISIREYLSLLRNTEQDMVSLLSREFRDDTRYENSQNAVAATWLISFDQMRRSDPVAADILSFLSCVENKAVPRSILPAVKPAEQMTHALGTLRAYTFLIQRGDDGIYDMHRLVHLATKVWLEKHGTTSEWHLKVAVHLAEIFPSDNYINRVVWREYFPHTLHFLRNTSTLDIEARYDLCMAVGSCLQADGRIGEAVIWLSECSTWRKERFPDDDPSRLTSQHELAGVYRADGQVKEAVTLLEQVVAIKEKVLKEDHPSRLASQHVLAMAYQADGQVKEAVTLLEQVVAIDEKVLKEDHPDRLISQRALLNLYVLQSTH